MTADVVNLNKVRKARAKADRHAAAATNRTRFGRPKAERVAADAETERRDALLDGAKLED